MNDIAISARNISKCYHVFDSQRARLRHTLWPKQRAGVQEIWALRDIDFDIRRGESVAIIGRNGGGKSTLLEIITGTLTPTAGEIKVKGRVSALLELGSGFNPEYTGRDNVILNGLLLGLSREAIFRRFDEIASFADIGNALDRPVKTYSSGMVMRLAYAVQVATDPDILIIDEALSVGDFFFQQKCFNHIRQLCAKGVTLLFVSHDMGAVRDLCTSGLFLKEGRIDFLGDNLEAIRHYLKDDSHGPAIVGTSNLSADLVERSPSLSIAHPLWVGDSEGSPPDSTSRGKILSVGVFDAAGQPAQVTKIGSNIVFRVLFRSFYDEPLHVSVVLKNKYDQVVTVTGSYTLKTSLPVLKPGQDALFELTVCPLIEAGNYSFSVSLGQATEIGGAGRIVDETPFLGPLQVTWNYRDEIPPFYGMVGLQSSARFVVSREA